MVGTKHYYIDDDATDENYKSTVVCNAANFSVKLYSESISVYQIFKIFLGGMPPDHPSKLVLRTSECASHTLGSHNIFT